MNQLKGVGFVCFALLSIGCSGKDSEPARADVVQGLHDTKAIFAYVDMMTYELKFYEPTIDEEASVDLRTLPGYGDAAVPLHAYITDAGQKVYVAFNGDATHPTGFAVIRVKDIFWHEHTADVELTKTLIVDNPAPPNTFPVVTQVDPRQPIQPWTAQPFSQLHGPAELPDSNRLFWTVLTDNRVVTIDTTQDKLLSSERFGDGSRFLHGISFNAKGNIGLGAGYFYDRGFLPVFDVKANKRLDYVAKIWLGTATSHAAYVHNVEWLTNRYALVGTMQFGPTSLTPSGANILGPSVWLVDAKLRKAQQIIGPAANADAPGIFRSASWVEAVGCKLFVGEEDSLDDHFGDDGYVSVFDISNRLKPVFIKRLKPGVDLPADFNTGHALVATPDGNSVILESYPSGYVLRIDTKTLTVKHVIRHEGGHHTMPHGGSIVSAVADNHTAIAPETKFTDQLEE